MSVHPWEPRLARLEGSFDQIDKRLGDLAANIDARFAQVDARFAQVDARFAQVDARFAQVDARLDSLDRKVDGNLKTTIGWMLGQTAVILTAVAAVAFIVRH
jgi:tetrahydromethanopterin S-methyltransferase subunit G